KRVRVSRVKNRCAFTLSIGARCKLSPSARSPTRAISPIGTRRGWPRHAEPCRADPSGVWELTNKANLIAIVSDGSRVLGLGNIGPHAGLPVMEGKALLFKYLG